MKIIEIILTAISLATDAFAASVGRGISKQNPGPAFAPVTALTFGAFQALMPLLGWIFGVLFTELVNIETLSGYIAFALLAFLGGKMIFESFEKEECCTCCEKNRSLGFKTMFMFAIATSIDALAIGVTVSLLKANIWIAISLIGVVTFGLSFVGSVIGAKIGSKFEKKAEFVGGLVLVLLALKFLIEAIF